MKKLFNYILPLFILIICSNLVKAQDDDEIKMTQKQWHLIRDQYAVSAIISLSKLDSLNSEIDSLKALNDSSSRTIAGCEDMLYSLVGATRQEVADFRIKFDEIERGINNKTLSPSDAEKTFYNEIAGSKIICLPEFESRYESLSSTVNLFTHEIKVVTSDSDYVVKEGDNLWDIAISKYGDPYMWRIIWDANKLQMKDKDLFDEKYFDEVKKPNLIYPGQVLKIPALKDSNKSK